MINFEKKDRYLLIVGEGERKDLLRLLQGATKIYSIIEETKSRLVLFDYRNVNFQIDNVAAFNTVRFYEQKLPNLTNVNAAVVLQETNISIGHVWGEVAKARGYNFKVFTDFNAAEEWLLKQ